MAGVGYVVSGIKMCRILILGRINRRRRVGLGVFGPFVHFLRFLFGGNDIFCKFAIERGVETISHFEHIKPKKV